MKGLETQMILAIILTIIIILILIIIVVNPAMIFGKQSGEQISFREFCFHWSIVGYPKTPDELTIEDKVTGKVYKYSKSSYCSKAGTSDLDACIKICKGAA